MKLSKSKQIFLCWIIITFMCIFLQVIPPSYNLGILVAILMIPIFIHDILMIFYEKQLKQLREETNK